MAEARYDSTYLNVLKSILERYLGDRAFSIFQDPVEESICINWTDSKRIFLEVFV